MYTHISSKYQLLEALMSKSNYCIDFQGVKQKFQQLSRNERLNILKHFAPSGSVIGDDYVVKCPWRSDSASGSFRVKLDTGCYHDFATGDHGDVIAFAARCDNCKPYVAADKLMNLIGDDFSLASNNSSNSDYMDDEPAKKENRPDHTLFIWEKSSVRKHLYLELKRISLGNARINIYKELNRIVVPLTDNISNSEADLEIKALQFIKVTGEKAFNKPMKGMFHIASAYDCDKNTVVIAEGFATARSISECIPELYVVACMSCCNMLNVALRIRELLPDSRIVLAADIDSNEAGQKAAEESIQALNNHNVQIIYPTQGKDFNDMLEAVGTDNLKAFLIQGIEKQETIYE